MTIWDNNAVQFPRLLCEIMSTQGLDLAVLAESMDLSVEEVSDLFDRANTEWEKIKQATLPEEPETMTGLMMSLDGGETWKSTYGVRVMFHDANEADDEMEDLLVNITTEGVILDLAGQASGEVSTTAALKIDDLIGLTC